MGVEEKLDGISDKLSAHGEVLARLDERTEGQEDRLATVESDVKELNSRIQKRIIALWTALATGVAATFGLGGK